MSCWLEARVSHYKISAIYVKKQKNFYVVFHGLAQWREVPSLFAFPTLSLLWNKGKIVCNLYTKLI